MFDKIPSLKDFIIYLIPGILICYFGLNIICTYFKITSLTTETISNNSVLTFVGIISSFLVGFLVSQCQIIFYNYCIDRFGIVSKNISNIYMPQYYKDLLLRQIKITFKIEGVDDVDVLKDDKIFYLCLNYIKANANEESNLFINRSSYLSTFGSVSFIPCILGVTNIMLVLNTPFYKIIIILSYVIPILMYITGKITANFRREWIFSIYRNFIVLSSKQNI